MSNSIIVSVPELLSRLQTINNDGMELVELSILESEEFDGDILPASVYLFAKKKCDAQIWIDYEDIEEAEKK